METRFFNGGHCGQLLALIDRRTWRWVRFHAVFFAVHHPREGWVLIDTGYGGRFEPATRRWPYRLYRWTTPATMAGTTSETLRRGGIDPAQIRHVVITHFHADHIGGLTEFPHARIHFHRDAWSSLARLRPLKQVRGAFLPDLVPDWLEKNQHLIAPDQFHSSAHLPFPTHDVFGDGSILLVDLPGHAPGHLGILVQAGEEQPPLLYVTDAFWNLAQLSDSVDLIAPVRALQWDGPAYRATIGRLRDIYRGRHHRLLACHAPETQKLVNAPAPPA